MPFDPKIVEAQLSLDQIASSETPKIAWDALEAGLDGKYIRRLAALDSPTYFQVAEVLPHAMREMGLVKLGRREAALRLAGARAKEILESGDDPIKHVQYFDQLWFEADYSRELSDVGNLDCRALVGTGYGSDEEMRAWIIERLKEFLSVET